MNYYLCAYGHVGRWSVKIATPQAAAKYCFGLTERVTVIDIGTRSPLYMSYKKKQELIERLKNRHQLHTGNKLTSY